MKSSQIALIIMLLFAISPLLVLKSCCQTGVVLYPSKGTALDNIVMEAYVPINSRNNIFWDNQIAIGLDIHRGQDNYPLVMNISCPNYPPYNENGSHTVTVESFYWDGSDKVAYFNTTFEIILKVHDDDWLRLNETYTQLLEDYALLETLYNDTLQQYNNLLINYSSLLESHNLLTNNYNSLLEDYNILSNSYSKLANDFNNLNSSYFNATANYQILSTAYQNLQDTYDQLQINYENLQGDCNDLSDSYNSLQTNFNVLAGETTTTRNMGYFFTATTMLFIATTIYFASRKQRQTSLQ